MENKELIYKSDARKAVLKVNPASAYCIDNIKPVDAVEVVRCEKCSFSHYLSGAKKYACRHPLYTGGNKHKGEHFCAYGERREGE